jgi:hypothetical protein
MMFCPVEKVSGFLGLKDWLGLEKNNLLLCFSH